MTRLRYLWLPATAMLAGLLHAQSLELQVELLNQIGTDTSRKGDLVTGRVLSPAHLQGDVIEGRINESRSGAKLGGQSAFSFTFDTLRHGGAVIPINSQFRSAANSKGRANVDEEGRMVRRANGNIAKAAGGTGLGAMIGGVAGGKQGAAIGAAAGAVTTIALIQMTADAPNIRFSPGSRVIIEASPRGGGSLAALAPSRTTPQNNAASLYAADPHYAGGAATVPPPVMTAPPPDTPAVYVPPTAAASAPPQTAAAAPAPQAPAAPAASAQPELTVLKSAFIPGEKTIFYDDFTDMTAGDAPPHFKVRGAAPELRGNGNLRQLSAIARGSIFPNLTGLPKNFTVELEVKVDNPKRALSTLIFLAKEKQIFTWGISAMQGQLDVVATMRAPYQELGRKRAAINWNEPVKLALWVQDGRLRVFANGEKHLDFNQVVMPEIDKVEFAHDFYGADQALGYRNVRFAESTPDFSQMITASGRYVTHGIQFDTDSDRLKPESAAVVQAIAKGLETNPNLKLLIEGHTDSVGGAAHNLDLSRRRAEAVKAVLCAQFKVDAARLTTAGIGAGKPLDSNDTPAGRAQNRRVEFVRQ